MLADPVRQHLLDLRKVVVLLSAVVITSSLGFPAGATSGNHGSGTGSGEEDDIKTGTDYGNPPFDFCLEVTKSEYHVDVVGDFWATKNGTTAGYEGPATLHWKTQETYYIAPEGIYTDLTADNECDPATLGDPVESKVWVTDPAGDTVPGKITGCQTSTGGYARVDANITLDWTGKCDVDGNVEGNRASTPSSTAHHFEGALDSAAGTVTGTWEY